MSYQLRANLFLLISLTAISLTAYSGSFARGEDKSDSDIDLVVKFDKKKSLLSLIRIEREISETVGRKIDLLTEESIHPLLKERIKSELRVLYQ